MEVIKFVNVLPVKNLSKFVRNIIYSEGETWNDITLKFSDINEREYITTFDNVLNFILWVDHNTKQFEAFGDNLYNVELIYISADNIFQDSKDDKENETDEKEYNQKKINNHNNEELRTDDFKKRKLN